MALLTPCLAPAAAPDRTGPPSISASYDFGGASEQAVALYRRGWVEILQYGRWQEAERLYREAVAADPGFTVALSVLARITRDAAERDSLYRQVQARMDTVHDDARLLLATYQQTLELFARREAGEAVPTAYREAMAARAVIDYGEFLARHPDEWSVIIEYVEWVHALEGAAAALDAVARLSAQRDDALSFSYFPAWFHAELGELDTARKLAATFNADIDDDTAPQPHYLDAFIALQGGDIEAARAAVKRALDRDPEHLLAQRLAKQIDDAPQASIAEDRR